MIACSGVRRRDMAAPRNMPLHHRIAHLERRIDGDPFAPTVEDDSVAVHDWTTIAADLDARAREADAGSMVELVLVRVDAEAAILTLVCESVEGLGGAWIATVHPWLDAHALVVVESAHQGSELLRIDGAAVGNSGVASARDVLEDFVGAVVGSGTVWGLYGKTWARSDAAGDREALPLWADPVAAARCIGGAWSGFAPRAIEIGAFREQWLTGMEEDGIVAVLGATRGDDGVIVGAGELLGALAG